ncbi:hypothetical protein MNBD_NITROSPINAE01-504 [hydrothermal vent metagenome]|uniref:General secretion pathway protein K n=1 Tax=hydrothermal vent metagenome TaxID=652676 RepID=A0A3B1BDU8_9ZZZZ
MALVTVLVVMAITVSLISFMFIRQDAWVRSLENSSSRAQAATVARSAIEWMGELALEDAKDKKGGHLAQAGPEEIPLFEVEGGELTGRIEAAQGKLNLNNLSKNGVIDQSGLKVMRKFFDLIDVPVELVEALADWVDKDGDIRPPSGAEDEYYLSLKNPYRTANVELAELNDLYFIKGFDKKVIDKLRPYAIALPEGTPLNVNTASAEAITAIFGGALPLKWGKSVVEARGNGFEKVSDFKKLIPLKISIPTGWSISVNSWYYLVRAEARFQRARVGYMALIEVRENYDTAKIIWLKEA